MDFKNGEKFVIYEISTRKGLFADRKVGLNPQQLNFLIPHEHIATQRFTQKPKFNHNFKENKYF